MLLTLLAVTHRQGLPVVRATVSYLRRFLMRFAVLTAFAPFAGSLAAQDVQLSYDSRGNIVAIEDAAAASALCVQRFAPAYGRPGDSVTVVGRGFSATPSSNQVTIGGVAATVTAAAADHLTITVPAAAASGRITVTVAAATATSVQHFTRLPTTLTADDVATATDLAVDAPAVRVNTLANRYALVAFAGQQGDLLSVQFAQLELPASGSATWQLVNAAGGAVASGSVQDAVRSVHLPPLASSGRYALYV